ncbi:hypothetical protein L6R53_24120 [Myxococcota bacterium]|nr:hypothetical protein [Myxococcota bacterium]
MAPLLLLLSACNPSACIEVTPVDPSQDGGAADDTGPPPDDTGDTGPIDTGPAAACDVPEVEPNHPYDNAQALPMEQWACGAFGEEDDGAEIFLFENEEPGWLRIWARAYEIGSLADITLSVTSTESPYAASRLSNPDSTDVMIVFPVDDEVELYATLNEQYGRGGEAYGWNLMASQVKAPLEWTVEEQASNDSAASAQVVVDGDRVFGKMNSTTDYDWYALELPEGRSDIVVDIEAWKYGSPADIRLEFYRPDGTRYTWDSHTSEEGAYDLDPKLTPSVTYGGTWTVKVMPEVDDQGSLEGGGGAAYWYVMDVSVESEG